MSEEEFKEIYSKVKDYLGSYEKTSVIKDEDIERLYKSLNETSEHSAGILGKMDAVIIIVFLLMFFEYPMNWNKEETPEEEKQ